MNLAQMSREELIATLAPLLEAQQGLEARDSALAEKERLLHELHVHQLELELQNRTLRESQAQLEESRSRYADLYDFAPVAYCTLDSKGCVRDLNLTGATMLGRDRAAILGLPFLALVRGLEPSVFWAHLRRCADTRAPVVTELHFSTARRGEIDVQAASVPVLDDAGAVVAFRTAFTDLTERKKAEAERDRALATEQRLLEQTRAALHARDSMLAVVAHDLRTPLTSIVLGAGLMPKGKHIDVIARTAQRMSRLVDDLLSAATIEAGRFVGEPRPCSAAAMIEEALQVTAPLASARAIRLTQDAPAELPEVLCDPDRILQVLSNLLGNATKFTPSGGEIRLDATVEEGCVRFAVSDTGPGIREDHLAHLFEPYWQEKPARSPGVGLGLYIAKGIVEALGGRIWVESEVGQGTTFFFTLREAPPGA